MKWVAIALFFMFGPLALSAFFVGFLVQSWAPWWIGQRGLSIPIVAQGQDIGNLPLAPVLGPAPLVSDRERYLLALAAGFSLDEAITATAISIAENGGGNPAALSPPNRDGSRDLGLWQVNSGWWPQFGGQQMLIDPMTNAHAAHYIYGRQGWCAWSVYDARCGPGHVGTYSHYLSRARAASLP